MEVSEYDKDFKFEGKEKIAQAFTFEKVLRKHNLQRHKIESFDNSLRSSQKSIIFDDKYGFTDVNEARYSKEVN